MNNYYRRNDNRFAGGFIGPFLLGGITGGLVAPLFYNNNSHKYVLGNEKEVITVKNTYKAKSIIIATGSENRNGNSGRSTSNLQRTPDSLFCYRRDFAWNHPPQRIHPIG